VIKVVVGMVLCVISLLTIYMAFLHLLDPWITKRRQTAYKQHAEEEEPGEDASTDGANSADEVAMSSRIKGDVLQRVGSQQDRWKRQVQDQRRRIYDQHQMLN